MSLVENIRDGFEAVATDVAEVREAAQDTRNELDQTIHKKGEFFANSVAPAGFFRVAGRVMVGDSYDTSGHTLDAPGSTWSWLKDVPAAADGGGSHWMEAAAKVSVTTEYGLAVLGAAHIKPNSPSNRTVIGVTGVVWNEGLAAGAPGDARAWGMYAEAHHGPASGRPISYTHAFELNCTNLDVDTPPTLPNGLGHPNRGALGGTISAGVSPQHTGTGNIGHALRIAGLGGRFASGIVFMQNSLRALADGFSRAILLSRLQNISWFDTSGNEVQNIRVSSAGTGARQSLEFDNGGTAFRNANEVPYAYIARGPDGATALNYLSLQPGVGENGPTLAANGAGADVNLHLLAKGPNGRIVLNPAHVRSYGGDAGAAAAGVPIGGLYRIGNALQIRLV